YTITATNNDLTLTYPVIVEDTLVPELTYYSHVASQGTFDSATGIWDVGDLGPGASAVLTLQARIAEGTAGTVLNNSARIENALGIGTDSRPTNDVARADVSVRGGGTSEGGAAGVAGALGLPSLSAFDPALSKVGQLQPGGIGLTGEKITWTINITNNGTATAYNVPLVDTVESEMRVDSADISKGSVAINGQTVSFTIPSLAPGETVTAHIYTTVLTSPLDGLFTNEASIIVPDGAGGAMVLANVKANVSGVGTLPSTGYPPDEQSGFNPWWVIILAAALLLVLTLGKVVVNRRTNI
ncbi:MAG: DUF11 domain-containing protein, partial [Chloroflexi bacterium]|nr:DUF11 domain-containing protein [Chloroflexota bacterium]